MSLRSPSQTISRDHAWVQREYGTEKWPAVLAIVQKLIGARRTAASLPLVLRQAEVAWLGGPEGRGEVIDVVVDGAPAVMSLGTAIDAYKRRIDRTVSRYCATRGADLVVELGSGWGHNVLGLAARDGSCRDYVGAEYTAAGRAVADALAGLDAGVRFSSLPFDYHDPDLRGLRGNDSAVVFTAHSVEQIPHLSEAVVDEILALARDVTCVHFEPVGWQFGSSRGSSELHARRHGYNRNLAELLARCERDGRIVVEERSIDVLGVNPANSTSVVVWRSRS